MHVRDTASKQQYLVDGAGDEAWAIRAPAEGDGEGRRERRSRLHRREGLAADVVAVGEAEDASNLVVGHQPCGLWWRSESSRVNEREERKGDGKSGASGVNSRATKRSKSVIRHHITSEPEQGSRKCPNVG